MKRFLAVLAAVLIAVGGLSACTSPSPGPGPGPANSTPASDDEILARPKVEFVVPVNVSPFWDQVKKGAFAAGKDLKVNILFNGPDDPTDSKGYLKLLRAAVTHKPLGIGVASQAASASDIPAIVKPAKDAGIQIVAVGSAISGFDAPNAAIMSNNTWLGENAAKQLAGLVKNKGTVVLVTNGSEPATKARADAFSAYVKKSLPDMKTVTVDGGATRADAKAAAQQALTDNPKAVGFFGTDAVTTLGIADAVGGTKKPKATVIGVDADPEQVKLVQDGVIAGAYAQNAFSIGYQTVRLIVDTANGTPAPTEPTVFSEVVWYTKSNLKDPAVAQILGTTS